ncbi:unnamed protein product [Hymenolepis diminuta]|uniref:rRNA methyltransferase 2, mitochondrial n=1 Tax=Hymenolepis diminuta TaxID=6216 RepID=A0A0R3SEX7_HYMDI|nr:unnamed protein product [Hymenolepis diminuta]
MIITQIDTRWLERQHRDPYVFKAQVHSYRCRSAFKLLELNNMVGSSKLIQPGMTVVDCGAAPGSWSQVAVELSSGGRVVAFDINDFEDVPGAHCIPRCDLRDTAHTLDQVRKALGGGCERCVDVVMSDIAPPASGLAQIDHPNLINLAQCVLQLALLVSKPGASLLVKLWNCHEVNEFKALLERFYKGPWDANTGPTSTSSSSVRILKPPASRKDSAEIYICAKGFCLSPSLTIK